MLAGLAETAGPKAGILTMAKHQGGNLCFGYKARSLSKSFIRWDSTKPWLEGAWEHLGFLPLPGI